MDFPSTKLGYIGNTIHNLNYAWNCRNFREGEWPFNNVFSRAFTGEELLKNVMEQNVGYVNVEIDLNSLGELKRLLSVFLKRHRVANYKKIRRKLMDEVTAADSWTVSRKVVKGYLSYIIRDIIPLGLFGYRNSNRTSFEKRVKRFLYLGKGQNFTLEDLMAGVSTKKHPYLKPLLGNTSKTHVLTKIYVWLLKVYLGAAFKCSFIGVESNKSRRMEFFLKRIWQKARTRCFNAIPKEVVPIGQLREETVACFYYLKIIPKGSKTKECRCLFYRNNKKFDKVAAETESIISKFLQETFRAFKVGDVSYPKGIHAIWLDFYRRWLMAGKPRVYYVRTDFSNAFGSVKQPKLMEILSKRLRKMFRKEDEIPFEYGNRIFRVSFDGLHSFLRSYVGNCLFKDNGKMYRLTAGIPQGQVLSSVLCDIYLDALDRKYFVPFARDECGFLRRTVDDYLYMTWDLGNAESFLDSMTKSFPSFGLRVNESKTKCNVKEREGNFTFDWYEIDAVNMQIYANYSKCAGINPMHATPLLKPRNPGKLFEKKIFSTSALKLDDVCLDSSYNANETIIRNVYRAGGVLAVRFCAYKRTMLRQQNLAFLQRCLLSCVDYVVQFVHKKINRLHPNDDLNKTVLRYALFKAFLVKFQAVGDECCNFVKILKRQMRKNYKGRYKLPPKI